MEKEIVIVVRAFVWGFVVYSGALAASQLWHWAFGAMLFK
jgi:hypothetical protein